MKLVSLAVENFRGIRKAELEFGPGLNVLYGPNDLGKSSIAGAIRAAFLLQTTSSKCEEFVSWYGAGDPSVTLIFESEPQRIWRVRKTFGSAGSAFLDESRDGVDFHNVKRGREVDGQLSEILRWGLAPPGGKGRPQGMSMTFLATALMAEQDKVAAIFAQALTGDSDESGKKRLIEALQAAAEDPLYKKVLDKVQERVDIAFTSTGKQKRGQGSPWMRIREAIQRKEEDLRGCNELLQKTESIEAEMRILRADHFSGKAAVVQAEATLAQIETAHRQGVQRSEIAERLAQRKEALRAVEAVMRELRQTETQLAAALAEVESCATRERAANREFEDATQRTQAAKEELVRLQSEDRARERLLQQESAHKQCAELRTRQVQTEASLALVERVRRVAVRVAELEAETAKLEAAANAAQAQQERALKVLDEAKRDERTMQQAGDWLRCAATRQALAEAETGFAQIETWRVTAKEKRAAAAKLEAAEPGLDITPAQLQALQKLDRDLEVARASLRVGLEVSVRAQGKLRVSVSGDDGAWVAHDLDGSVLETAAHREIAIAIDNIAGIVVSGGSAETRRTAAGLQSRWAAEVEPVLTKAGASNVAGLARKIDESAARALQIKEARSEATQLEQRVADQPDWAALRLQRQAELATAESAVAGLDEAALEKLARGQRIQSVSDAEKRLATIGGDVAKRAEDERRLSGACALNRAALQENDRAMSLTRAEFTEAQSAIEGDWESALARHRSERDTIGIETKVAGARLAALGSEEVEVASQAEAAVATADAKRARAEAAHHKAQEEFRKAENTRATIEGQLTLRKEAAAKSDEAGARNAVSAVEAELELAPKPAHLITAAHLEQAGQQLCDARLAWQAIAGAIQTKSGALQHVGGDVAKQHAADAHDALRAEKENEQDVQNEFAAWDLLKNTLLEAEREEGVHLGRALGGPIAERFGELTHGRYGHLNLGPDLATPSITAAGAPRELGALSVGTREQLSTIFRLTLAEKLNSAVMLDDQLTQTDSLRMAWLRDLIRVVTRQIQVVVFTCRPSDYVLPEEMNSAAVHSIDLEQAIKRGGSAAAAAS